MNAEREAATAAAQFRKENRLGRQPLTDLVTVIERATGVDVAVIDAAADAHGMTAHDPGSGATFIAVAQTRRPMRQRSTLAHELGHYLFQDRSAEKAGHWTDRDPYEVRADAFARHLLVPVAAVKEFVATRGEVDEEGLSSVVQWFGVSPALAAIALRDAKAIGDATKSAWMRISSPALAARYGWIDQYNAMSEVSHRRRSPQKLATRAIRGYREGVVGVQAVARLLGISDAAARRILDSGDAREPDEKSPWATADGLPDVDGDLGDLDDLTEPIG